MNELTCESTQNIIWHLVSATYVIANIFIKVIIINIIAIIFVPSVNTVPETY